MWGSTWLVTSSIQWRWSIKGGKFAANRQSFMQIWKGYSLQSARTLPLPLDQLSSASSASWALAVGSQGCTVRACSVHPSRSLAFGGSVPKGHFQNHLCGFSRGEYIWLSPKSCRYPGSSQPNDPTWRYAICPSARTKRGLAAIGMAANGYVHKPNSAKTPQASCTLLAEWMGTEPSPDQDWPCWRNYGHQHTRTWGQALNSWYMTQDVWTPLAFLFILLKQDIFGTPPEANEGMAEATTCYSSTFVSTTSPTYLLPTSTRLSFTPPLGGPCHHPSAAPGFHPGVESEKPDLGHRHHGRHHQVSGKTEASGQRQHV